MSLQKPAIPFRALSHTQQIGSVPSQRSQVLVIPCPARHSIFCLGGALGRHKDTKGKLDCFEMDLRTGEWKKHIPKGNDHIRNMWGMKGVYRRADHSLYMFGGNKDTSLLGTNEMSKYGVYCLDLNTMSWRTKLNRIGKDRWRKAEKCDHVSGDPFHTMDGEKIGKTRYGHSMEMRKNQASFVVFGGESEGVVVSDFSEFDFRDLMWKEINVKAGKEPTLRYIHGSAMTSNELLVIFGGRSMDVMAEDTALHTMAYFDFNCMTWFNVDINYTFPLGRYALGMGCFQAYGKPFPFSHYSDKDSDYMTQKDFLILHGGRNDRTRFNDTFIFDFETGQWRNCMLVDDSISEISTDLEPHDESDINKQVTISDERKLKRKMIAREDVVHRGGNMGCSIAYYDLNYKPTSIFYDYSTGMTTYSGKMVANYPTSFSKKFISFGGKTGETGNRVYDSSLLMFDVSHFDYHNDPSLLIDPNKSGSTMALLEDLSIKLWYEKQYCDYIFKDKDESVSFDCHTLILVASDYFRLLIEKKDSKTCLSAKQLEVVLMFCYGIELTPHQFELDYHLNQSIMDENFFIELYCTVSNMKMLELKEYMRKLVTITMTLQLSVSMFKNLLSRSNKSDEVFELMYYCADYIRFNIEPVRDGLKTNELEVFLNSNNFGDVDIQVFHSCLQRTHFEFMFEKYISKRVLLSREYLQQNLVTVMNSTTLQKLTTCSNIVIRSEDGSDDFHLSVPSSLLAMRFDYFNTLIYNQLFQESSKDCIELPSMIFCQQHAAHPVLNLAAIIYYAYTNSVDYLQLLQTSSVFPPSKHIITQVTSFDESTLIQYVVDLYSVADFIASSHLKECIFQYVRKLVGTMQISQTALNHVCNDLRDSGMDLMGEIADLFEDCILQLCTLAESENEQVRSFVPPPEEEFMVEEEDE